MQENIRFSEDFLKVGNINYPTPLVDISHNIGSDHKVFAKLEYKPPNIFSHSIKDRTAKGLILNAYYSGLLDPEKTIVVEPTSGNMGIALAGMLIKLGFRIQLVLPYDCPKQKIEYLKYLEAKVLLSDDGLCPKIPNPYKKAIDGAIALAWSFETSVAHKGKYYMPYQYGNPANPAAHYHSTGYEIWEQTENLIDYIVAGIGTGGTTRGISLFFKKKNLFKKLDRDIKIIGIMPEMGHHLPGLKNLEEAVRPPLLDMQLFDRVIVVSDDEAYKAAFLLHKNGFNVGPSSGAALAGLLKAKEKGVGVVIFADGNELLPPKNLPKYYDFFEKFSKW
ncbi:MAG: PLP-dependent cysteine synthase family protein [Candidatus Helarchaeota archaeon]